jgi:hypothetical protein
LSRLDAPVHERHPSLSLEIETTAREFDGKARFVSRFE